MPSKIKGDRIDFGSGAVDPLNPTAGSAYYDTGISQLKVFNGIAWDVITATNDWQYLMSPSKGIVLGGYKDSVSWYTVNKATYATDTTSNLGDIMTKTHVYNPGMASLTNTYSIGTNDTTDNSANTNWVGTVSHSSESWTFHGAVMPRSRNHADTVVNEVSQLGYVMSGGSTRIDVCSMTTNTWSDAGVDGVSQTTGGTGSAHNGYVGDCYHRNGTYTQLNFASMVVINKGNMVASNVDRAKGMVVSPDHAWYFGGLGTSNHLHYKVSYTTNTSWNTGSYPTSFGSSYQGESNNCAMPQNSLNYVLGGYNGAQNNISGKFNSATEVTTRVSTLDMIGHAGASSGAAGWNAT